MANLNKIDSNFFGGFRYALEDELGTLPGSPVWLPLDPNGFSDFGGALTLLERRPLSESRQRKKGAIVDLDSSGGFNIDLTQDGLQDLMQGFMFADFRRKQEFGDGDGVITAIDDSPKTFAATAGLDAFRVGALAKVSGSVSNNNLFRVTVSTASLLTVNETTVAEGSPPAATKLTEVGFQFASGDLTLTVTGAFPVLGSTLKDLTQFGLSPGEWVYIGGDASNTYFGTAANNGFARVRSVATNAIVLDKTQFTFTTDSGSGKTIQIFFGRVLKNETGSDIVRRTYQFERLLGAPDPDAPTDYQGEYLVGAVANECKINIPQASKITCDMSFVGKDFEQVEAGDEKSGDRPTLSEEDCFNTSSDFSRIKLSSVSASDACPTPLFAFVTDITLGINNHVTPDKAVGVLGAFEMTAGIFEVGGSLTAYFSTIEAVQAVRDNADVTIDCHMVKENSGISIDMPLIALGNGRLQVVQDQAIKVPLDLQAATAAKIHPTLNHTMLWVFWDYLPDAAE